MRKRLLAVLIFSAAADAQLPTVIIRAGTLLDGKGGVDAYLARDFISWARTNLDRPCRRIPASYGLEHAPSPKTDMTANLDCLFKHQIGRSSSAETNLLFP